MRLAELSRRSGVARSTIKFYLREGLLPPGVSQGRNQALYDERHLERLRLIRALREVAGLSLEVVGRVAGELDRASAHGWESDADPIGEAWRAMYAPPARERSPEAQAEFEKVRAEVAELMQSLPWTLGQDEVANYYFADELADAVCEIRRYLYPDYPVAALGFYASEAWRLSEREFAQAHRGARVPQRARGDDIAEPTRRAILATVLFERIFGALRRCANSMRSMRIGLGLEVPPAPPDPGPR
jgi:DNA-binding transcriptional MerR regulator